MNSLGSSTKFSRVYTAIVEELQLQLSCFDIVVKDRLLESGYFKNSSSFPFQKCPDQVDIERKGSWGTIFICYAFEKGLRASKGVSTIALTSR